MLTISLTFWILIYTFHGHVDYF